MKSCLVGNTRTVKSLLIETFSNALAVEICEGQVQWIAFVGGGGGGEREGIVLL